MFEPSFIQTGSHEKRFAILMLPARTSRAAVFEVARKTFFQVISIPQKLLGTFRPSYI